MEPHRERGARRSNVPAIRFLEGRVVSLRECYRNVLNFCVSEGCVRIPQQENEYGSTMIPR